MITEAPSPAPVCAVTPAQKPSTPRVVWVDNLRTATILLVVNMHACVTYSHVGSWYYMVSPEPPMQAKVPFILWQAHLQAFFMGLLFFIAGYFADRSLARKTTGAFLADRFKRLGIPTLIYMLGIHPLIVFALLTPASERPSISWYFTQYIGHGRFIGSSGPMWFAFALLLICIPFGLWFRSKETSAAAKSFEVKPLGVLGLGVGLGLASFLVRLVQPFGTSILNFQLCFFAQYFVAFGLGVVVSRRNALHSIATGKIAVRAGWMALILGPIALAAFGALTISDLGKNPPPFAGGWNWEALAEAIWEQTTGVGLALGAMAICAKLFNTSGPVTRWLADRSFGVYLLHPPVLVALAIGMASFHASIYLMAIVLTIAGYALSLAAADIARRVPLLKSIL